MPAAIAPAGHRTWRELRIAAPAFLLVMDERGAFCAAGMMCADIEARAPCPFSPRVAACRGVKQCGQWLISAEAAVHDRLLRRVRKPFDMSSYLRT